MIESTSVDRNYLKAAYDVLDFLASVRDTDDDKVWSRILEKTALALNAEAASYFVVGLKGRELTPRHALGIAIENLTSIKIERNQSVCGWVSTHREPVLIEDAYKDPRFLKEVDAATGFKTRCILAVPLMDRLDMMGVFEFLNRRDGPFTAEDLTFVQAVCRQTAYTLRMLRMETMLNKVTAYNASILENLTGGFIAVDLRGRVMICNPAAKRILELQEDIVNSSVDKALPNIPGLVEVLMQTLSTKQIVKRKDLSWSHESQKRLLGYSTLLIQDPQGHFTGVGVTFQDITGVNRGEPAISERQGVRPLSFTYAASDAPLLI